MDILNQGSSFTSSPNSDARDRQKALTKKVVIGLVVLIILWLLGYFIARPLIQQQNVSQTLSGKSAVSTGNSGNSDNGTNSGKSQQINAILSSQLFTNASLTIKGTVVSVANSTIDLTNGNTHYMLSIDSKTQIFQAPVATKVATGTPTPLQKLSSADLKKGDTIIATLSTTPIEPVTTTTIIVNPPGIK